MGGGGNSEDKRVAATGTHMTLPGKAGAASGTTGLEPRLREGTAGSSQQRRRRSFRNTALCGHLVAGLTSQIRADVFADGSEGRVITMSQSYQKN